MKYLLILLSLFSIQVLSLPEAENALIASGPNRDFHRPIKLLWNAKDGPVIADVEQNGLGDCWFLATLASILESTRGQDVITSTIKDDSNPNKADVIVFNQEGTDPRHYIVEKPSLADAISGFFSGKGGLSISGGSYGKEARSWVAVFEGAMEAAGYSADIESGGWSHVAIKAIYGGENGRYHAIIDATDEELWKFILATPGKPSVLSTTSTPDDGFVPNHAYSLLGSTTGDDSGNIILRNPWGHIDESIFGIPNNPSNFHDLGDGKFDVSFNALRKSFAFVYML